MSMRRRFRLGVGSGLLMLSAWVSLPACAAILGIDPIPEPGEILLDASGTCAQLEKQKNLCDPGCFLVCNDEERACLCPPDGGDEGFLPDNFVSFDALPPIDVCQTIDCLRGDSGEMDSMPFGDSPMTDEVIISEDSSSGAAGGDL
jgi:hypothetical protein